MVSPSPSPETPPETVVTTILAALAANDAPRRDHGAAVVFAFASERMRQTLGGEAGLRSALHNTLYRHLLGHRRSTVEALEVRGAAARAVIAVEGTDGSLARFTLALARSTHGDRSGCWLLTGLAREGVDL